MNKRSLDYKDKFELIQQELDFVNNISNKVNMEMDLSIIIKEIVSVLWQKLKFDGCNVALINDNGIMKIFRVPTGEYTKKWKNNESADRLMELILQY